MGATQSRTAKDAHNRDENIKIKTQKDRIRNEKFRSDAKNKANYHACHPETPFVV